MATLHSIIEHKPGLFAVICNGLDFVDVLNLASVCKSARSRLEGIAGALAALSTCPFSPRYLPPRPKEMTAESTMPETPRNLTYSCIMSPGPTHFANSWRPKAETDFERCNGARLHCTGLDLQLPDAYAVSNIDEFIQGCDSFTIEVFVHIPDRTQRQAGASAARLTAQRRKSLEFQRTIGEAMRIVEAEVEAEDDRSPGKCDFKQDVGPRGSISGPAIVSPLSSSPAVAVSDASTVNMRRYFSHMSKTDALWQWPVMTTMTPTAGWELNINSHGDVAFSIAHQPFDGKHASVECKAPQTARRVYGPWTYRAITYDRGRVTTFFPCTVHCSVPGSQAAGTQVDGCLSIRAPNNTRVPIHHDPSGSMVTATPPVWSPQSGGTPAFHGFRGCLASGILGSPDSMNSSTFATPIGSDSFSPFAWQPGSMSSKMFSETLEGMRLAGSERSKTSGEESLEGNSIESIADTEVHSPEPDVEDSTASTIVSSDSDAAIAGKEGARSPAEEDYIVSLYASSSGLWPAFHDAYGWGYSGERLCLGANRNFEAAATCTRHAPYIIGALRISKTVLHPQQFMDVGIRSNAKARQAFVRASESALLREYN